MGVISSFYNKALLHRYDKDGIIPYLSEADFPSLQKEEYSFINSKGIKIAYFIYKYPNYSKEKVILFAHGLGPGHTAYMAEINALCSAGYKIFTLDYAGCDKSEGDSLISFNEPSRDINDLLDYLKLKEEVVLVGHSLGGYSSLNVISRRDDIKQAVILSGFISYKKQIRAAIKSSLITKLMYNYEKKIEPVYMAENLLEYIANTKDKLLFIQSVDDVVVPFKDALGEIMKIENPNISYVQVEKRYHNPNYSVEAVQYMRDVFGEYNALVKNKTLKTLEDKQKYMADKSAFKMTIQDPEIIEKIINFIS